jgi:hypothetical protein
MKETKDIEQETPETPWRRRLHDIIFEADTRAGRTFDLVLLWLIISSIVIVMLESVKSFRDDYGEAFYYLEWIFTILFTLEFVLRLIAVRRPLNYIFSFYGVVDLAGDYSRLSEFADSRHAVSFNYPNLAAAPHFSHSQTRRIHLRGACYHICSGGEPP